MNVPNVAAALDEAANGGKFAVYSTMHRGVPREGNRLDDDMGSLTRGLNRLSSEFGWDLHACISHLIWVFKRKEAT